MVEGAVPGLELLEVDPDSLVLVPVGHEPAAPVIAEEVGLQPAGQEAGPQPELVEQVADGEDGPPGGGVEDVGVFDLGGVRSAPAEEPLELGQDLDQEAGR